VVRTLTCRNGCEATVAFRAGGSGYVTRTGVLPGTHLRAGETVSVRYDRSDPTHAEVIGASDNGPGFLLFLAALLGALGIAGAVIALRGRAAPASEPAPSAVREDPVLYRERRPPWLLVALLVATAVAFLALRLSGHADQSDGVLVAAAIALLFAVGPLTVSAWMYSRLLVTSTELRVGGDQLPLADLDRDALRREAAGDGAGSPSGKTDGGEAPLLLGGGWLPRLGQRHLLLKIEGEDRRRAVPTRHPDRLLRALQRAMSAR